MNIHSVILSLSVVGIAGCHAAPTAQQAPVKQNQSGAECTPPDTPLSAAQLALLKKDVIQRHAEFEKALRSDHRLHGVKLRLESGIISYGIGCAEIGMIAVYANIKRPEHKRILLALIEQWRRKPNKSGRGIDIAGYF